MTNTHKYKSAVRLVRCGEMVAALGIVEGLIRNGYAPAYFLRGSLYERGGPGVPRDLDRAISDFRQAACSISDPAPYLYLARALMQKGDDSYAHALKYIREAEKLRRGPEIDVVYAAYFERASPPQHEVARRHYLRVMLEGRFVGFIGYSRVSRLLGQRYRAAFVDILRIALSPIILLLVGNKSRNAYPED